MPHQQVPIPAGATYKTGRHARSPMDKWLMDQQRAQFIPMFRQAGIELYTLWKCSDKELYELFCSAGLSQGETISLRQEVMSDRQWRGNSSDFDYNVFEELHKLVEEEDSLALTLIECKDVKAEVDKACDQYLATCKSAVEEIRKETHEMVERIKESTEERASMLGKAKITARKYLSNKSGSGRDARSRIKSLVDKVLLGHCSVGFSSKPIYTYKEPNFQMLQRCLTRRLSIALDDCERWDPKNLDHEIRIENFGSRAVKINNDCIANLQGAVGHKKGIHTWFIRVDGKEFHGKAGVHFIVLGITTGSKKFGWCTRTNAPSYLSEDCRYIGSEETYAVPGETVEITVNIEQKILTFSLPRYGSQPFLTVELPLVGGESCYPWAQLYNKSYGNAVTISAYI